MAEVGWRLWGFAPRRLTPAPSAPLQGLPSRHPPSARFARFSGVPPSGRHGSGIPPVHITYGRACLPVSRVAAPLR